MATLKGVRQRFEWGLARFQNVYDELTAAKEHFGIGLAELEELILAEEQAEPEPQPEPEPEPEPEPSTYTLHVAETELGEAPVEDGATVTVQEGSPLHVHLAGDFGENDAVVFVVDGVEGIENAPPYQTHQRPWYPTEGQHTIKWTVYDAQQDKTSSTRTGNIVGEATVTLTIAHTTVEPEPEPEPDGSVITHHTFTEPLEDGWTDRGEGNYSHGVENGDGYGQAKFGTTTPAGTGPIQVRTSFDRDYEEITIEWDWQLSDNFNAFTGSTNKKTFLLEVPGVGGQVHPVIIGQSWKSESMEGYHSFALQRTAMPGGGAYHRNFGHFVSGERQKLTVYMKVNTVDADGNSNPDGIARMWVDGNQVFEATDLRYRGNDSPQADMGAKYWGPTTGFDGIRWNPTWPNGGDSPVETMYEKIFDIKITEGPPSFNEGPGGQQGEEPSPGPEPTPTDPPSADYPNLPEGLNTIAHLTFEDEWTAQVGECWPRESNIGSTMWTLADATAPNGHCMRGKFPAGAPDGVSYWRWDLWGPGLDNQGASYQYDEFYFSFWLKVEGEDFENQSNACKIFYWMHGREDQHNDSILYLKNGTGAQTIQSEMAVIAQLSNLNEAGEDVPNPETWGNKGTQKLRCGEWTQIELYCGINTINEADGKLKVWVNGVLSHDYNNIRWRSNINPRRFYGMQFTPVWGGNTREKEPGAGIRTRDDHWRVANPLIAAR